MSQDYLLKIRAFLDESQSLPGKVDESQHAITVMLYEITTLLFTQAPSKQTQKLVDEFVGIWYKNPDRPLQKSAPPASPVDAAGTIDAASASDAHDATRADPPPPATESHPRRQRPNELVEADHPSPATCASPASSDPSSAVPTTPNEQHTEPPPQIDLSPECTAPQVQQAREAFHSFLLGLEISINRDNKKAKVEFTEEQSSEITGFFFDRVLGSATLAHIRDLQADYEDTHNNGVTARSALTVERLAEEAELPVPMRKFYRSFDHVLKATTVSRSQSLYQNLRGMQTRVDLFRHYTDLKNLANGPDPSLRQYFESRSLVTRRGVSMNSLVIKHLAETLGLSTNVLVNQCQQGSGLSFLVDSFGPGILAFLPRKATNKLHRWGVQRMTVVYKRLKQLIPHLEDVCKLADQHIIGRIQQGLPIGHLTSSNSSLTEALTYAVTEEEEDDDGDEDSLPAIGSVQDGDSEAEAEPGSPDTHEARHDHAGSTDTADRPGSRQAGRTPSITGPGRAAGHPGRSVEEADSTEHTPTSTEAETPSSTPDQTRHERVTAVQQRSSSNALPRPAPQRTAPPGPTMPSTRELNKRPAPTVNEVESRSAKRKR